MAVVGKKAYVFGGSSGSGYGEHSNGNSEPVYLNDLFVLRGKCANVNKTTSFEHCSHANI